MQILRNQAKKRPGLDFCDFRLERNSSEKLTFAQKSASHSNFKFLMEQKSNEKPTVAQKSASYSKFRNSEGTKLEREARF